MKRRSQRITQSFVVQARLNPRVAEESAALDVVQAWLDKDHSMRAILTEALNALGGRSIPEPNRRPQGGIDLAPVERMLDSRMLEMAKMIERLGRIADDLANAEARGVSGEHASRLNREVGEISDVLKKAMYSSADFGEGE